jgi:trk system potassium uptake protein TrkH
MSFKGIKERFSPQLIIIGSIGAPIIIGTILLMLPWSSAAGQWTGALTALFTATSAMCVTGHIIVDPGSYFSFLGQIIILILVQIGGLGFMTMAMALLIIAGRRMSLLNETALSLSMGMQDSSQIKHFLYRTILFSLILEMGGAVLLAVRTMLNKEITFIRALYEGLFHSVCAFCNAGFSLYPDNLICVRNDKIYLLIIMLLIVLGGMGFLVLTELYYDWRKYRSKRMVLSLHSRMVVGGTVFLILAGWIMFAALEWDNTLSKLSVPDKCVFALFQSITPRTAGFNVVDMAQTSFATRFVTDVLMFIGGSPGSTAGGIKTTTSIVLIFAALAMIRNRREITILGRTVSARVVSAALAVFLIALVFVTLAFGLLLITEHNSLQTGRFGFDLLLFDMLSAFGTVGLSAGTVSLLTPVGKLIFIACMFIGRVGPLTLALFIGMKEQRDLIRYPDEDVIIG